MSLIAELRQRISPDVKENEPMAPHTTFKVGGPSEYFLAAKTADEVTRAAAAARDLKLPFFVFGGGSNMLVSDAGVKGLVVMMANRDFRIERGTDGDATIIAGAGAPTGLISMRAAEAGLTGFEWAVGVPGTIGGAVRGNAGAYGGDMAACVTLVRAIHRSSAAGDAPDVSILTNAECDFTYRHSKFKNEPGWIVLEATLKLAPSAAPEETKARLKKILLDRKEKQPVEFPTAGCMFTNWTPPPGTDMEALKKALDLGGADQIPRTPQGGIPAGWIIDRAGLKGFAVGHVRVSDKHGNFFVTDGKASADEVVQLTAAIKTKVRNMTDGVVQLTEEVEYVGF
ncbi:MAG: hypothetical protein RLZZ324_86 [Candidatus Parcubacteria bacterium]